MDILKEAEMIVERYISKIEEEENSKNTKQKINNKIKRKYWSLKKVAIVLSLVLIISIIINVI